MKLLTSEYNKGQDEYFIQNISSDYEIEIGYCKKVWTFKIGFYEFLFNPKYKVFEVFKFRNLEIYNCCFKDLSVYGDKGLYFPKEIIKYLEQSIKESK